jgi:hypothetical protein
LSVLVGIAVIGLALISLTALLGPISALSVVLALVILAVIAWLIAHGRLGRPGRAAATSRRIVVALFTFLAALIVAAAVVAIFNPAGLRTQFVVLTLTGSVGMAATGIAQASIAEAATTAWVAESWRTIWLARTVQPMITALGDVAGAQNGPDRREAVEVLVTKAVGVVKVMSGRSGDDRSRTRSMYYQLESDDRLVLRKYVGEYGQPRREFLAHSSENDRRVVELAKGETVLFVNDLDATAPAYFTNPRGRPYKSLISVPVRAGAKSFGILMIDAEYAGSLTDLDVANGILIAGLLGAGLAVAETPTSSHGSERADTAYLNAFAATMGSVFAEKLAHTVMSFELVPEDDRELLAGSMSLDNYSHSVEKIAKQRAERKLDDSRKWPRRPHRVVRPRSADVN